ncbi:MAG: methyl-accepting chemotaxis protein [Pseudomonadota bacterium]
MRRNEPVTGNEHVFPGHYSLITTTNLRGRITYVNDDFAEVAGFSKEELVGQPHNIIRHPDMPPAAFQNLWETIQSGRSWKGIVKNRCKNGDHYWVDAYVTPIRRDGHIVEFQSVRVKPDPEAVRRAEKLYAQWTTEHLPTFLRLPDCSPALRLNLVLIIPFLVVLLSLPSPIEASLLPIGLGYGLAAALVKLLTQPLGQLCRQADDITENPVMAWVYTGRRDSIGRIRYALGTRWSELRAVSARLHDNAGNLDLAKNETIRGIEASKQAIEEQRQEISHISEAIEHLSQSVERVSNVTQESHDFAENASDQVNECQHQMSSMNRQITLLAEHLKKARKGVGSLAERSQEIGVVLQVITDIAEQTNLLALNAAIEAARAGEAGRGFAVVADEVRALAQRTHQSTQQITEIIEGLQSETDRAVSMMDEGVSVSETTVDQVNDVSEALSTTLSRVSSIVDHTSEVASATEEQATLNSQVSRQADDLREMGDRSVGYSDAAMQQADQLSEQIEDTNGLTRHFLTMLSDDGGNAAPVSERPPETEPVPDNA